MLIQSCRFHYLFILLYTSTPQDELSEFIVSLVSETPPIGVLYSVTTSTRSVWQRFCLYNFYEHENIMILDRHVVFFYSRTLVFEGICNCFSLDSDCGLQYICCGSRIMSARMCVFAYLNRCCIRVTPNLILTRLSSSLTSLTHDAYQKSCINYHSFNYHSIDTAENCLLVPP